MTTRPGTAIDRVTLIVTDLDRAEDDYVRTFGCRVEQRGDIDPALTRVLCIRQARGRRSLLRLGRERIELLEFTDSAGRPCPPRSTSTDLHVSVSPLGRDLPAPRLELLHYHVGTRRRIPTGTASNDIVATHCAVGVASLDATGAALVRSGTPLVGDDVMVLRGGIRAALVPGPDGHRFLAEEQAALALRRGRGVACAPVPKPTVKAGRRCRRRRCQRGGSRRARTDLG